MKVVLRTETMYPGQPIELPEHAIESPAALEPTNTPNAYTLAWLEKRDSEGTENLEESEREQRDTRDSERSEVEDDD